MEETIENPFELFKEWYDEWAEEAAGDPTAMTVATAGKDGQPSSRIVLLKDYDERGFVFYTNYTSRKAHDLAENPKIALSFHWESANRQVHIEGEVEKTSDHEADAYFDSRPRGSQIGAWASKQSRSLKDKDEFAKRIAEVTESFEGEAVPRPPFWGGYRVVPNRIEFWQRGEHRLHTRLVYERVGGKWKTQLLYP
jgi:pyridoxamine 5'-phosphate oxidase